MRYYAGLDVSLEETAMCIVDETGKVIRELRAAIEPDALIETLAATGLGFERIGLEPCSLSSWLHQGLTRAGGEAADSIEPCQCAFDDPTARENHEAFCGIGSLDDFDGPFPIRRSASLSLSPA